MQTITEALAEVKTIDKRIEKKQQFLLTYLVRQDVYKDPLEKDGGSFAAIQREMQAVADLRERTVAIRRAVADANARESVTIKEQTRSIADWLTWRREVAPKVQAFLQSLSGRIVAVRKEATGKGLTVIAANVGAASAPQDIVVYVNEQALSQQIEGIEEVLGILDGQLSLKNATVTVNV